MAFKKNNPDRISLNGMNTPGTARIEHFQPGDFTYPDPTSYCIFCGLPFARSKPFKGKHSEGVSIFCSHCRVRIFHNTATSAIVSEAYRRLMSSEEYGPTFRAALTVYVN